MECLFLESILESVVGSVVTSRASVELNDGVKAAGPGAA